MASRRSRFHRQGLAGPAASGLLVGGTEGGGSLAFAELFEAAKVKHRFTVHGLRYAAAAWIFDPRALLAAAPQYLLGAGPMRMVGHASLDNETGTACLKRSY